MFGFTFFRFGSHRAWFGDSHPGSRIEPTGSLFRLTPHALLLTLLIFLAAASPLFAQTITPSWSWQSPVPQGNLLGEVYFCNELTGYATDAEAGTILKTTDGGSTWKIKYTMPPQPTLSYKIYGIHFPKDQTGYAVGHRKLGTGPGQLRSIILKTTDAGETWVFLNHPDYLNGEYSGWLSVHFPVGPDTGYFVGRGGNSTLKTTDGGGTWIIQNPGTEYTWLRSVQFPLNAQTGYIAGGGPLGSQGVILKTTNGGVTWQIQLTPANELTNIHFPVNAQIGYAIGAPRNADLAIFKTTNGGSTWITVYDDDGAHGYAVHFTDNNTGYASIDEYTNRGAMILKTTNGGSSWNPWIATEGQIPISIHFPNPQTGFAVGMGWWGYSQAHILKTTNAGNDWSDMMSWVTSQAILAVDFQSDGQIGCVVGPAGTILKTTNGGAAWLPQSSGTNLSLRSVHFPVNRQTGYAVGGDGMATDFQGVILKTIDGGDNWMTKYTLPVMLRGVHFPADNQTGYVVGGNLTSGGVPCATILKTTDGGETWVNQYSEYCLYLQSVQFPVNADTGYVVGLTEHFPGRIMKTTNGGATWVTIFSRNAEWYVVDFPVDNQTGYVAGYGDIGGVGHDVIKTTDGGMTWVGLGQPVYDIVPVRAMSFSDDAITGYIGQRTGGAYKMAKTTDGGATWVLELELTGMTRGNSYYGMALTTGGVYAVGSPGMIRKFVGPGAVEEMGVDGSREMELRIYPNPFRTQATINYQLSNPSLVRLMVYNVAGQLVNTLVNEHTAKIGNHNIIWDGRSKNGQKVPAGVYFLRLETNGFSQTRKLVLLR